MRLKPSRTADEYPNVGPDLGPVFLAIAILAAGIYVSAVLGTLVHELGHAYCYRRVTGRRAVVYAGQRPGVIAWRLKWVEIHFDPRMEDPTRGRPECVIDPRGLTVSELRQVFWGGPVFTGVLGLWFLTGAVLGLGNPTGWVFLTSAPGCLICFAFVVEDLIPKQDFDGLLSDGGQLNRLRGLEPDYVLVPEDAPSQEPWQPAR